MNTKAESVHAIKNTTKNNHFIKSKINVPASTKTLARHSNPFLTL